MNEIEYWNPKRWPHGVCCVDCGTELNIVNGCRRITDIEDIIELVCVNCLIREANADWLCDAATLRETARPIEPSDVAIEAALDAFNLRPTSDGWDIRREMRKALIAAYRTEQETNK